MSATDVARWQFGITTLYHYIFIPVTLGLSFVVAAMETVYVRTKNPAWRRMTLFWGQIFVINVAMGVVTGIVQEFQFGMNWSTYSAYVGDVFGAPLALEGLVAFFLESTFIGLWIFTWDRFSPRLHATVMWLTAVGSWISAIFILVANAWMQHPVGYILNGSTGRAQLTDFGALFSNPVFLVTLPHTILAAGLTAGAILLGVGCWHLLRSTDAAVFMPTARIGAVLTIVSAVLVGFSGHVQAQIMTTVQPMKMASAEALFHGENGAEFSLFAIGDVAHGENSFNIALPHMLSVLATNSWNGYVAGIDDLQSQYQTTYGPGDYEPNIAVTYWTFRVMVGTAFLSGLVGFIAALLWRRGILGRQRWFQRVALGAIALPFIGNFTGWIFTEMGRQPWVVFGLLKTDNAASPSVGAASVWFSFIAFTLLYGVLAVITIRLVMRRIRAAATPNPDGSDDNPPAAMAY
ncbi:MAG TPA: cytochrome ubiquinol oxidase subunit I [Candidatus Dormibacteraeota bacterium]